MTSLLKAVALVGAIKVTADALVNYLGEQETGTASSPTVRSPKRNNLARHSQRPVVTAPTSATASKASRITDQEKQETYRNLPVDEDAIRVVWIAHRDCDDKSLVECEIITCQLTEKYEALSWVWYENEDRGLEDIIVGGKLWAVPSNLVAALKVLRADSQYYPWRALWIDALCLDQDNHNDTRHGIPRMRDIYSHARQVLFWIGPPMKWSDKVFSFFNSLPQDVTTDSERLSKTFESNKLEWTEFWNELRLRKFWTRLWIIQEVASASSAMVHCGVNRMSWDIFRRIAVQARFLTFGENPILNEYDGLSFYYVDLLREHLVTGGEMDLMQLIFTFKGLHTSRQEDCVYALLGISKDRFNPAFLPDYRSGYVKVWTSVTKELIRSTGRLDFITLRQSRDRDSALPSWVPDLSLSWSKQTVDFKLNFGPNPQYNAANGRSFKSKARSLDENRDLQVQGIVVDTITSVSEFSPPVSQDGDELILFKDICCRMALGGTSFPRRYKRYPFSKETYERALSRTLVGDVDIAHARRAPTDYGFFEPEHQVPNDFFPGMSDAVRRTKWQGEYLSAKFQYLYNRRFIMSKRGYMGLVPEHTEEGDFITVLDGATVPIVLRSASSSQSRWKVIGACYVHGIMDGEAGQTWFQTRRDFNLI